MPQNIKNKVTEYYTQKIIENGSNSKGVDWNSKQSHFLRFDQLTKLIETKKDFTILDYGCGYGALIDYFEEQNYSDYGFYGYDISEEMIKVAQNKYNNKNIKFATSLNTLNKTTFDYVIANGIFNVKLDISENQWKDYLIETLHEFNKLSIKGFSFNVLTSYSDKEYMKDYLYYSNPLELFDYCKRNFSKQIALLHDYQLYEFTIIVRK